MNRLIIAAILPALAAAAPIRDADTRAWWALTAELSSDAMQGRDTGSPGYARAAGVVEARFRAAGLKPAGERGFRQTVPLHEVKVEPQGTRFAVTGASGEVPLRFLHEISVRASAALPPAIDAGLSFRGYCSKAEMGVDLHG